MRRRPAIRSAGLFTPRSQVVLAGLSAIVLLITGGSYLIGRAVVRELRVARLQSDFVSAVSHEFRTPLTAMRQMSELLVAGPRGSTTTFDSSTTRSCSTKAAVSSGWSRAS